MKRIYGWLVFSILSLFLLMGCSSVHQIGTIGTQEIWQVKTRDWVTPNTVTVFTHNVEDGAVHKVEGGVGRSGLGQIAGPSAAVGAAYFIGKGIGDSGDRTTIQQSGGGAVSNSSSKAKAEGGEGGEGGDASNTNINANVNDVNAYGGTSFSASQSSSNAESSSSSTGVGVGVGTGGSGGNGGSDWSPGDGKPPWAGGNK
jgi:hypothetical protein